MEFHYEQHGSGIKQLQASSIVSLTCLCRSWMYTLLVWRIVFFSQTLSLPLFMHKSISFVHTKVLCTQCTLLYSACVDTHGRPAKKLCFRTPRMMCFMTKYGYHSVSLLSTVFTHTHTHTRARRAPVEILSSPVQVVQEVEGSSLSVHQHRLRRHMPRCPHNNKTLQIPTCLYKSFICATHDICVVYARDMRTFSIFITIVWEVRRK